MSSEWIALASRRPAIGDMHQTEHVLVAYYPGPDTQLEIGIAFYDSAGVGSGWFESGTFNCLPAPRYWMPFPPLP